MRDRRPRKRATRSRPTRFKRGSGLRSTHLNEYLFADDSGLEVDALGGEPGVYSARYAGEGATDADNNALLLERLSGVANRAARFVCVIALVRGGQLVTSIPRRSGGQDHRPVRAAAVGFGYDPFFFHEALQLYVRRSHASIARRCASAIAGRHSSQCSLTCEVQRFHLKNPILVLASMIFPARIMAFRLRARETRRVSDAVRHPLAGLPRAVRLL